MTARFLTELVLQTCPDSDCEWILAKPLVYFSRIVGLVDVPAGFNTDLASVPRVPIAWEAWGARCHRESVVHDYLYRTDSVPDVARSVADQVFMESMKSRGVSAWIRWPMYWGVRLGGWGAYHRKAVKG